MYLPFYDWFEIKRGSVWFQGNYRDYKDIARNCCNCVDSWPGWIHWIREEKFCTRKKDTFRVGIDIPVKLHTFPIGISLIKTLKKLSLLRIVSIYADTADYISMQERFNGSKVSARVKRTVCQLPWYGRTGFLGAIFRDKSPSHVAFSILNLVIKDNCT